MNHVSFTIHTSSNKQKIEKNVNLTICFTFRNVRIQIGPSNPTRRNLSQVEKFMLTNFSSCSKSGIKVYQQGNFQK